MWLAIPIFIVPTLAIAMILMGRRARRIDTHPLCRACGFDLDGLAIDPDGNNELPCPECGGSLVFARDVRTGHRRANRWIVGAGITLLTLDVVIASLVIVSANNLIDWSKIKTVGMLVRDGQSSDWELAMLAVDELSERTRLGKISPARQRSLAERVIELHESGARVRHNDWASLFQLIEDNGLLDDDTCARQFRAQFAISMSARPHVRQGDPLPLDLGMNWLGGISDGHADAKGHHAHLTHVRLGEDNLAIDQLPDLTRAWNWPYGRSLTPGWTTRYAHALPIVDAPTGTHRLSVRVALVRRATGADDTPSRRQAVPASWTVDLEQDITVTPASEQTVATTDHPGFDTAVRTLVQARAWHDDDDGHPRLTLLDGVFNRGEPARISLEVLIRCGDDVRLAGYFHSGVPGYGRGDHRNYDLLPGDVVDGGVTVVLRASVEASRRDLSEGLIWLGDDVVLEVPLTPPSPYWRAP